MVALADSSLTATTTASASSFSRSATPSTISWERLSPEAAWTTVHLAWPISCGVSISELAGRVSETSGWVTRQLDSLRRELERLS